MLSVSGCRGLLGDSMTPEVAAGFGGAFGGWLQERAGGRPVQVVLGRDGRRGSDMVRSAAVAGLLASGCDVVDLGIATTPTTAVMTDHLARARPQPGTHPGIVAGMEITASHNPQPWCGLKCLVAEGGEHGSAACAPPADIAAAIIERFRNGPRTLKSWSGLGTLRADESGTEEHVDRVMEAMEAAGLCEFSSSLGHGLKVAADSVNGSGIEATRLCLESLGCDEILHIGADSSGVFSHPPEPTAENLTLPGGLCDAVREGGCDVGFAQDPDADRLALIDERGHYVGEEYTLVLSAMALLEGMRAAGTRTEGAVLVTNLSTSRMLDDVAARHGASVVRTPVGEAHVVAAMKRLAAEGRSVVCGGEGNGGIIWPRVAYVRDSLSGMALTLRLLQAGPSRRTLSSIIAAVPSYAIVKRKVDLPDRAAATGAVEKISRAYRDQRVDRQDGAWVDFTSGPLAGKAWLHVRASNTEPIMRLIAEAPTTRDAARVLDDAAGVIAGA